MKKGVKALFIIFVTAVFFSAISFEFIFGIAFFASFLFAYIIGPDLEKAGKRLKSIIRRKN